MRTYKIKETGVYVSKNQNNEYITPSGDIYDLLAFKDLGLTLEEIKPEVKKLYAHCSFNNVNEVVFYTEPQSTRRRPVYDIEYPVSK